MRFARLPLTLLVAIVTAGALAAQAPVRVVSFNIRYGTADDGDHVWANRRAHVVTTIHDHAPHILGLQEALRFQLDELEAALPGYREVGVGRDDGRAAGEYSPLLVDTARFAIVEEGTFWFSDSPEVAGSASWGNTIPRICSWARLSDRATGDTLRAYNVHWDHVSQPSRAKSAALLLQRIVAHPGKSDAILVLGDFNSDEGNPAYRALVGDARVGLRDTFRALHPRASAVGTFHAFKGDSSGGKIDFVLVGPGWRVLDASIDHRRFVARWASDHFAVSATIRREGGRTDR